MNEVRQWGKRCWRGGDRRGSEGGKLDVWDLMRVDKWEEDRRDINAEERQEGESGDGTDGRQKQDGGMQKIEETEGCGQTEMGVDWG